MQEKQTIDRARLKEWERVAYIIFSFEQTGKGLKQFCKDLKGDYKVLLNGKKLIETEDLDEAVEVYDKAFANKSINAKTKAL